MAQTNNVIHPDCVNCMYAKVLLSLDNMSIVASEDCCTFFEGNGYILKCGPVKYCEDYLKKQGLVK